MEEEVNNNATRVEEGSKCLMDGCDGTYVFTTHGDCTCHIAPPCKNCVDSFLACDTCYVPGTEVTNQSKKEEFICGCGRKHQNARSLEECAYLDSYGNEASHEREKCDICGTKYYFKKYAQNCKRMCELNVFKDGNDLYVNFLTNLDYSDHLKAVTSRAAHILENTKKPDSIDSVLHYFAVYEQHNKAKELEHTFSLHNMLTGLFDRLVKQENDLASLQTLVSKLKEKIEAPNTGCKCKV